MHPCGDVPALVIIVLNVLHHTSPVPFKVGIYQFCYHKLIVKHFKNHTYQQVASVASCIRMWHCIYRYASVPNIAFVRILLNAFVDSSNDEYYVGCNFNISSFLNYIIDDVHTAASLQPITLKASTTLLSACLQRSANTSHNACHTMQCQGSWQKSCSCLFYRISSLLALSVPSQPCGPGTHSGDH